jgi:arabinofuranan 3-O-arabinosyltransferase
LVRNDTAPTIAGYTPPQVVNETLVQSGFHRVASFGPPVAASPGYPNIVGQAPGFALSYSAIEIFEASRPTARPTGPVATLPVSGTVLVNGGPDALLPLIGQGVLTRQPAVIAGQKLAGTPAIWAVTDGQRRADNDFGATDNFQSFTYTATESNPVNDALGGAGGPPRQILPVPARGHQTVAVLSGAASVTASSAGSWLSESPQYDPVNAFDLNPATAWAEASPTTPVGQWIQINFGRTIDLPSSIGIRLLGGYGRSIPNQLRVTTASGSAITNAVGSSSVQPIRVSAGPSRWLRVTITGASNVVPGQAGAGISDVLIPGVRVTRYLQPAEDPAGTKAPAVVFSFMQQISSPYQQGTQAVANQAASQQLDRFFALPTAGPLSVLISAVPNPGPALEALISSLSHRGRSQFRVTASSTWNGLPIFGPDNLFEPIVSRPWLASAGDTNPQLALSWHGRRTIRKIVLKSAYGLATAPTGVLIGSPVGDRLASVGLGGIVRVSPPLRTDKLYLTLSATSSNVAGNTANGQPAQLPLGLAKVSVPALAGLHVSAPTASRRFQLGCGSGPAVKFNGHAYETAVRGTLADLIQLLPVRLRLCSPAGALTLEAGRQTLVAKPSSDFTIANLTLSGTRVGSAASAPAPTSGRVTAIIAWQPDNRRLRIGPGAASYLEIHENANPGWTAALNGRALAPATLDGWQQAFVVPAGRGGIITLTFGPTALYHDGIIGSAIALLLLLVIAVGTGWRGRHTDVEPDESRLRFDKLRTSAPTIGFEPMARPSLVFSSLAGRDRATVIFNQNEPRNGQMAAGRGGRHRQAGPGAASLPLDRERHPAPRTEQPADGCVASVPPETDRVGARRFLRALIPLTAVILIVGGPAALAVPVLAFIGSRRERLLPAIAFCAMLAAGLIAATARAPTAPGSGPFSLAAQALALIALAAALLPVMAHVRAPRERGRLK